MSINSAGAYKREIAALKPRLNVLRDRPVNNGANSVYTGLLYTIFRSSKTWSTSGKPGDSAQATCRRGLTVSSRRTATGTPPPSADHSRAVTVTSKCSIS
ncbi:hypothetical protein EVAR_32881_1 [Eumeta japonica]|uniref:Uncharacterized protein n=1 Tax=Eumeta variegata TaxID=151549 RepID=A0A4C1VRA3_EUMVA|nr:hypothetical protein EVAR_32881_1 [Eumeta japonica]